MSVELMQHQLDAIKKAHNGCIFNGGVGTGKSITSLGYYYLVNEGDVNCLTGYLDYIPMNDPPLDLYIITTARKRDTGEWEMELNRYLLSTDSKTNLYTNKVVVDSWNNISKYINVENAFFIFDEQRVVGSGVWVKSFLHITKNNKWVLLTATAGDCWSDYIPVFVANGFYKNRSEFLREHVVYSRFSKYPKIDRYINTGRLVRLRNSLLIDMKFEKTAVSHHEDIFVDYDMLQYKTLMKDRWNIDKNQPIETASELCYELRKNVNSHPSRAEKVLEIVENKKKVIIFYNFDYELDILLNLPYGDEVEVAQWNGHKHQEIPLTDNWVYLVQYTAGAEGWNCIKTDTIIFYSQNYSYKTMVQSSGRIDRLNTPFNDLYYYHLKSHAGIDLAIAKALKSKKKFNELKFVNN